jgi:hypothetical protein
LEAGEGGALLAAMSVYDPKQTKALEPYAALNKELASPPILEAVAARK